MLKLSHFKTLFCLVALSAVFVGCGGYESINSENASTSSTPPPPPPPPTIPPGDGQTLTLNPPASGVCNEDFEALARTMVAGDTMIIKGGTYCQDARRSLSLRGTAQNWFKIMAAPGETVIFKQVHPASHNNLEIASSAYLFISGIHFEGGSQGIRIISSNNIILDGNEIFNTLNNAIPINSGSSDRLFIRNNHIHHTGRGGSSVEGEGLYVGCNDNTCRVTNSIFENNYIHNLFSDNGGGNDGIEVKVGSGGNIIRNNVIHTHEGVQYPAIFVYGNVTNPNIIEGNFVYNTGEGIVAISDAIVRNNIVINSKYGIATYSHVQVPQIRNVTVINNTLINNNTCLLLGWANSPNSIAANNAIYCPTTRAFSGNLGSAIVKNNFITGPGMVPDNMRFFSGGTLLDAFVDSANWDFWPKIGSVLRGGGDSANSALIDFNGTNRTAPSDVGAYETEGLTANPGWKLTSGFKQ